MSTLTHPQPFLSSTLMDMPPGYKLEVNVAIYSDLRCVHPLCNVLPFTRDSEREESSPTSGPSMEPIWWFTTLSALRTMNIDKIKKEIQWTMWNYHNIEIQRSDFVMMLEDIQSPCNDEWDHEKPLVKLDFTDTIEQVFRRWEIQLGSHSEKVRVRIDPCKKSHIKHTASDWRPQSRPVRRN